MYTKPEGMVFECSCLHFRYFFVYRCHNALSSLTSICREARGQNSCADLTHSSQGIGASTAPGIPFGSVVTQLPDNFCPLMLITASECFRYPYPLKNGIWGGGAVLKFHFIISFLQSCILNDQYSSSFHVIGKQVKIKYLRLAPEELSTCQTEAAHV